MRPTPREPVIITNEANRVHSGSVSPPVPSLLSMDSMNGKIAFSEKIREMYSKDEQISPADLEKKIDQLWKGLSQTQKEQFILRKTNGSRLNIPVKQSAKQKLLIERRKLSDAKSDRPLRLQPPSLTRRDNCKAIAKVLDLHGDAQNAPRFADTVKHRMWAYKKEASISRKSPPMKSPRAANSHLISAEQLRLAAESVNMSISARPPPQKAPTQKAPTPPINVETSPAPASPPAEKPLVPASAPVHLIPPNPISSLIRKGILKRSRHVLHKPASSPPPRSFIPQISYDEACQKYYSTLSQASLLHPIELSSLPAFASVVEGSHVVREYTIHDRL